MLWTVLTGIGYNFEVYSFKSSIIQSMHSSELTSQGISGKSSFDVGEDCDLSNTNYSFYHGSQKMETYHEHPRHCKLRRYGVGLHGTVGKVAARHQSRPTSCCKERCCKPLLDVILLRRCQTRMLLLRSHVEREGLL